MDPRVLKMNSYANRDSLFFRKFLSNLRVFFNMAPIGNSALTKEDISQDRKAKVNEVKSIQPFSKFSKGDYSERNPFDNFIKSMSLLDSQPFQQSPSVFSEDEFEYPQLYNLLEALRTAGAIKDKPMRAHTPIESLNELLADINLYKSLEDKLPPGVAELSRRLLRADKPSPATIMSLNRLLMEAAYPQFTPKIIDRLLRYFLSPGALTEAKKMMSMSREDQARYVWQMRYVINFMLGIKNRNRADLEKASQHIRWILASGFMTDAEKKPPFPHMADGLLREDLSRLNGLLVAKFPDPKHEDGALFGEALKQAGAGKGVRTFLLTELLNGINDDITAQLAKINPSAAGSSPIRSEEQIKYGEALGRQLTELRGIYNDLEKAFFAFWKNKENPTFITLESGEKFELLISPLSESKYQMVLRRHDKEEGRNLRYHIFPRGSDIYSAEVDGGNNIRVESLEWPGDGEGIGATPADLAILIKNALSDAIGKASFVTQKDHKVGGIDFRTMNYLVQPMGSFKDLRFMLPALSNSALERIDLDKELESLRDMVKAGMVPSGERVKEYLAACFQKGKIEEKQDDFLVCLAEIYRLAEEENLETGPELRESLVIVDTGKFVLLPQNR